MNFKSLVIASALIFFLIPKVFALGNHPESGACPDDKPFFVFCSHSLHNLEGWMGSCHKTKQQAEVEAAKHVQKEHGGNSRWTGVKHAKYRRYQSP